LILVKKHFVLVAAKDNNWHEEGKVLETMGNINIIIITVDTNKAR